MFFVLKFPPVVAAATVYVCSLLLCVCVCLCMCVCHSLSLSLSLSDSVFFSLPFFPVAFNLNPILSFFRCDGLSLFLQSLQSCLTTVILLQTHKKGECPKNKTVRQKKGEESRNVEMSRGRELFLRAAINKIWDMLFLDVKHKRYPDKP